MSVIPPSPLHAMEDLGHKLQITIPAPKLWFPIFFFPIWLLGWTVGGIMAIIGLIKSFDLFLLLWLGGWMAGEIMAIHVLLWMLTGHEFIEVSSRSITVSYKIFGFGWPKEYLSEYIENLRVLPMVASPFGTWGDSHRGMAWWMGDGIIAFDYGAKTFRLGIRIDEPEGKQIIEAIQHKFPGYRL